MVRAEGFQSKKANYLNLVYPLKHEGKMSSKGINIVCPHCDKSITLDEALTSPIRDKISKELEKKHSLEVKKIEQEALKKANKKVEIEFKDLKEQLEENKGRVKKAEEEELKLRKEKRKLEEDRKKFELDSQRKLDEKRGEIYEEAEKKVTAEHELKDKEKIREMEGLKRQIAELKRKSEQGSQKTQGDVLELSIEQVLKESFSDDRIERVSSGVRGADILQEVCLKTGKLCGTILFECKNTRKWSDSWISKLKKDLRERKADIGVIVTTTLPEGIENFNCYEGIVIVHNRLVIPLTNILRNQLFETARTKEFNVGKNEKLQAIYKYLTGTDFKHKVESVVEAFDNMMLDLYKERKAMTRMWEKREKQIGQAFYGIAGIYGGMQGIIGSSLPEIKSLSMPELLPYEKEQRNTKSRKNK